ncbi:MAG: rhamnulose-1-phosphate aldolase [Lachnospiraceae bacterium]|nr:rhamnulose-1-phosphate aldolase [Lachnospiraceae bacterium]
MKILDSKFVKGFINMAQEGYEQGWHERNGGNLSYRMTPHEVESIEDRLFRHGEWTDIKASVPGLSGEFFLVTGSGKYFRNIPVDPEETLSIIELDEKGERYRIRWGLVEGGNPTSELPTHLLNHEIKKRVSDNKHRIIYHAHCTNIIALSFLLPLKDEIFTRELWESMTECPVVFPEGIGVVPWMVPGGRDIGLETSRLMEKYNAVIWAHHGIFCSGDTFDGTFGLMHTIEKSAEILLKIMQVTDRKVNTITPDDFRRLAKDFGVELDERFLYEKKSSCFNELYSI